MLRSLFVRTWKNAYSRVFEPARACGKRRSQPGIVGGAVLERPSAKIRPRNAWSLPFCENWTPRKFLAIRYSGLNLQSLMWVLMVDDKVVSHIHYIMVTVVFTKWTMPSCYVHALMLKHTLRIFWILCSHSAVYGVFQSELRQQAK